MRDAKPKTQAEPAKWTAAEGAKAAPEVLGGEPLALKLFTHTAGASIARAPAGGNGDGDGGGSTARAPFGIVVDDGRPVGPGQIGRARFVAEMSAEIERVAGEELAPSGRTTRDCPYLAYWIGYYRDRDAAQIERVIERYARPARADLDGVREAMLARVRTAVQAWVRSGGREVQAPAGVAPLGGGDGVPPASVGSGAVQRKGGDGAPESADAGAVRAELGTGQPLEPGVRGRMERGFGRGFGDVRLHTGGGAARLAGDLSARAFALGSDVAFAPGEYRPGSLEGDALLAHELAHVTQQRGAAPASGRVPVDAPASPAERQADAAAAQVTRSLWSHDAAQGAIALPQTQPLGALRLQRCNDPPAPTPAPPAPSPRDQMRTVMDEVLADHAIVPAEWQRLNERAQALHIDEVTLGDLAEAHAGVARKTARHLSVLAIRPGRAFNDVRASYTGSFTAGGEHLEPNLVPVLLNAALTDHQLDYDELDALRTLAFAGRADDLGDLEAALRDAHLDPTGIAGIIRVLDVSGRAWRNLRDDPVALPIRLGAGAQPDSLAAQGDLRVTFIRTVTGDGSWSRDEFRSIRELLRPLGFEPARQLLVASGIAAEGAYRLARQFTATDAVYAQRMQQEILFRRDGERFALVTPEGIDVPPGYVMGGGTVNAQSEGDATPIGPYTFRSGTRLEAERQIITIRGRRVPVIRPVSTEDLGYRIAAILLINDGLAPVPPHHVALIRIMALDPGVRDDAAADASQGDYVVNVYLGSRGMNSVRLLVHEVGHLVSYDAASRNAGFWASWHQAAEQDDATVSMYGATDHFEDFAESYLLFILNEADMTRRFPHRAAIIAPLVHPRPAPPPAGSGSQTPPPARP